MPTVHSGILAAVLGRLQADPAIVAKPDERVRLSHRTPPDAPQSPSIYIVPQQDTRTKGKSCDDRRLDFRVQVFGRSDAGITSIDDVLIAIMDRLRPVRGHAIPYPAGVTLEHDRITFDEEVADKDQAFAELHFTARYSVDEWMLEN